MATFNGTSGNNNITGTQWGDAMFGNAGNDTLSGGKGADYLHGGTGIDRLFGGDGDDKLNLTTLSTKYSHTNTALELLDGGSGSKDNAHIDAKGSFVDGMPTTQINIDYTSPGKFFVSIGSESGFGNAGLATAVNVESFTLAAEGPAMFFTGAIGGTSPALTVTATNKADEYCGGTEDSTVSLLGGADTAIVSAGHDVFTLGDGADVVRFNWAYSSPRDGVITDFKVGEDHILLDGWGGANPLTVTEDAGGTWLKGGDDSLYLAGIHGHDSWADFIA